MFYAEPTEKDMFILKAGIEDIYDGDYYIYAEEIGPETAKLLDKERGWIIVFMFLDSVKEHNMPHWLACGLSELRVNYTLMGYHEEVSKDV